LFNCDGQSLLRVPIERRRDKMERMLPEPEDPLRLSPLLKAPTGEVLQAVRKLGLEGVVGKRIGSTYEPGERSGAWIKWQRKHCLFLKATRLTHSFASSAKKNFNPFANQNAFCV
jgi:ATP-dependent DNA ligase